MLCTTMGVINRWCQVRQLFTQRNIFGLMWTLDPSCRTGEPYTHLLRDLDPKLLDLAWARTGARYDNQAGSDAQFSKRHHRYGYWLRTHHADKLGELLFDRKLGELGVFDLDQVRFMYEEWRRERPGDDTSLSTQLSSIATICLVARRFDIEAPAEQVGAAGALRRARAAAEAHAARVYQMARRISRPWRVRGA
jgi:asparagine synthase (glutamine-hydrolysing)